MLFDSAPLRVRNCRDCLDRGIGLVHQEIQVVAEASVAENIIARQVRRLQPVGPPRLAAA